MASKKDKDKECARKEDDSNPRRRQYAFDDIAALNKGATPDMATKDDFVLAYKTSSNKLQYICDKKDLLLPWAQILTARLKAAGRLGSILETETIPNVESTVPSASRSDLTYLTESVEESGLEVSDAAPQISAIDYNIDVLEKQKHMPSILKKYETDKAKQTHITDKTMSALREASLESKFGIETASCSRDTVDEGENSRSVIAKYDEVRAFESDIQIRAAKVDTKKIKFTVAESSHSPYTSAFAADEIEKKESGRPPLVYDPNSMEDDDPDFANVPRSASAIAEKLEEEEEEEKKKQEKKESTTSELEPFDKPKDLHHHEHDLEDHAKTKGLVTDTVTIRWGKNEMVDYRVSTRGPTS